MSQTEQEGHGNDRSLATGEAIDALEEVEDRDIVERQLSWGDIINGVRVLVADDDPEVLEVYRGAIASQGGLVTTVENGSRATAESRAHRYDVVITDAVMPEMDGWDFVRSLRRNVLYWDIPIVVLSWREDLIQRFRSLEAGANAYVLKESDRSRILATLCDVIAPQRQVVARVRNRTETAGKVDHIGIVPLLLAVAARGDEMLLSIRETWNLYELEFEDGKLVHALNRVDGHVVTSGIEAVGQILGVREGRFSMTPIEARSELTVFGELEPLLNLAVRPMQELMDGLTSGDLLGECRLTNRVGLLERYKEAAPGRVCAFLDELLTERSPHEALMNGTVTPSELERIMVDLIRRGLIPAPR